MTVREMHIGLDLHLAKLNTEIFEDLLPEHKDWLLNEATLVFINNRVNPESDLKRKGFQYGQKRYDDLEELITPHALTLYKEDAETVFGILPYNYRHLVNDRYGSITDCDDDKYNEIQDIEYLTTAKLKDSTNSLYENFKIVTNNNTILFNIKDYPAFSNGLQDNEEKFMLISLVIEEINRKFDDIVVRWENYDQKYYPYCFVFHTSNSNYGNISITTDTTDVFAFTSITRTKYSSTFTPYYYPGRLTRHEIVHNVKNLKHGGTKPYSPIVSIRKGRLYVHHNKTFILNSCKLEYIRKPRTINLSLNRSCEINDNYHDEIVTIAARIAGSRIMSGNYQAIINEQMLQE